MFGFIKWLFGKQQPQINEDLVRSAATFRAILSVICPAWTNVEDDQERGILRCYIESPSTQYWQRRYASFRNYRCEWIGVTAPV